MNVKHRKTEEPAPQNIHLEDDLVHIQKHKGIRARFELYIHNEGLRTWLKQYEILIPSEEDKPTKRLGKKTLFYNLNFGHFLQALCGYVNIQRQANLFAEIQPFVDSLEAKKLELWRLAKKDESPWDGIYKKLTKLVKTKNYEELA